MVRKVSNKAVAGGLFFMASTLALLGIITAESLYPTGYSTRLNEISDLGATRPPNSVSYEPSASIFNTTMMAVGMLTLVGVVFLFKEKFHKPSVITIGLFGLGVLGVGIFPGNTGNPHVLTAMLTFLAGGIAALISSKTVTGPFKPVSIVLGSTALTFWFLAGKFLSILGPGGTERFIAYPIVIWLAGFGGYLMGRDTSHN